ncbi:ABC transporter ATP-binding protein [Siculibacillus lacustris]|uniref:ABC transporter ATP-binding protein n=1 Tax=Siculibacillus lacustris TaxID=1549641 RepID=A0A4Q9VQY3_9HYPH|nr:ABC transporter ATP-binding protein [Siculibacillus lacustris]TBW38259.1 ABC transporter ATP-binding protein [Siculibacillus lacustris]
MTATTELRDAPIDAAGHRAPSAAASDRTPGDPRAVPVLEVHDLGIRTGGRDLVAGVTFSIGAGRTLALIGQSGSGKSMTAAAIMGLLPPDVTVSAETRIELDGRRLPHADDGAMRAFRGTALAMVFQDPMSCLNPFMTVGAQIEEALWRRGVVDPVVRRERSLALMAAVELPTPESLRRRLPHELSGGQQQRIMLAMALAAEPRLLIADEPTSALDASVQAEILALLARLQARFGMAILFITHDLAAARRLGHEIMVMRHGRVVDFGAPRTIFTTPRHPHTRALVAVREMLERPPAPRRSAGTPVLEIAGVGFDYPPRRFLDRPSPALREVSLTLTAGRSLGVIGESGSGKSTLAAIVAGLKTPISGDVRLFGTSLAAHRFALPRALRRRVQIVFQNPHGALNPRHTIATAMREPLDLLHIGPRRARPERVAEALGWVGLDPDLRLRHPHALSGGQRQRVAIARALLSEPDLLVCDEVVSALDATVGAEILDLLRRLQAERGFALMFVGHDLEVVRWIADEIAVLADGRLVEHGPADRVLVAPASVAARRLVEAGRRADQPSDPAK